MSIVSDTGPLIALAKADLLPLIQTLYGHVLIPPDVHRELLAKTGPETHRLDAALALYIEVSPSPPASLGLESALAHLGGGEQQAITLAHSVSAPLLIDDRAARAAALHLGVEISGTAGVLVQAKAAGLIPLVRPVLEAIRDDGYYLSDALLQAAAKLAGEQG